MNALALVVLLAAAPPAPSAALKRAVDAKLPVAQRVAAIDELTKAARREDLAGLRPLRASEDPALLAAFLRFVGAVPDPEGLELAKELYGRTVDPKLKALAIAALQPKLLEQPADLDTFLGAVLATELGPDTEAIHGAALKKLVEVNAPDAVVVVLRYESRSPATLKAQLDALYELRAISPAKVSSFARQHTRSPNPAVAERAKQIVATLGERK